MRGTNTLLCAIPASCWSSTPAGTSEAVVLQRLLPRLAAVQRRLAKGIAAEEQELRYARLCERIEQIALSRARFAAAASDVSRVLAAGDFPAITLGSEYTDLLCLAQRTGDLPEDAASQGRLGDTVIPPAHLARHLAQFQTLAQHLGMAHHPAIRHRSWFIRSRALPEGCGLVEVPESLGQSRRQQRELPRQTLDGRGLWQRVTDFLWPATPPERSSLDLLAAQPVSSSAVIEATDWQHYSPENRGAWMQTRLTSQISAALRGQGAINLANQRHNMAIEGLQPFVHVEADRRPVQVALHYGPGLATRPFPLQCLQRLPSEWTPTRELHVGLVSMRHLPIDRYIDINWYRNVEVPSYDGMPQADEHCFQVSLTQLRELLQKTGAGRLRIHLYHSGFVPAVIGFYRALVTVLADRATRAGSLQVVPKLKPGLDGGFEEGKRWPE